jgi:hypothetical protein
LEGLLCLGAFRWTMGLRGTESGGSSQTTSQQKDEAALAQAPRGAPLPLDDAVAPKSVRGAPLPLDDAVAPKSVAKGDGLRKSTSQRKGVDALGDDLASSSGEGSKKKSPAVLRKSKADAGRAAFGWQEGPEVFVYNNVFQERGRRRAGC